jgi:hypothetical protein
MKRSVLILFFLVLSVRLALGQETPRHDLTLTLSPERSLLQGIDRLTLPAGAKDLSLFLDPAFAIQDISLDGKPLPADRAPDGTINLALPSSDKKEGGVTVEIAYEGTPRRLSQAGAYLFGEEAPFYPHLIGAFARFRVTVQGPANWEAISQDRLEKEEVTDRGKITTWTSDQPTPFLTVLAGPYRSAVREAGGVRLATYFYPEEAPLSGEYLSAAEKYLGDYTKLLGPFPYRAFSMVEVPEPIGEAFPSMTLLGREVVKRRYTQVSTLGHELVHSWFGAGVFPKEEEGNWSEALTAYLANDYPVEALGAKEAKAERLSMITRYSTLVNPRNDYPLSRFRERESPIDQAIGYDKGAFLFHMLRRLAGDATFFSALQSFAAEQRGRAAGWEDLRLSVEKKSGKELRWFFSQWVKRPGVPRLEWGAVRQQERNGKFRLVAELRQVGPPYRLSVPIEVQTERGPERRVVTIGSPLNLVEWTFPGRVKKIVIDPDADVFKRLNREEMTPSMNLTLGDPDALFLVSEKGGSADLLETFNRAWPHPVRSPDAATPEEIDSHSLFIVGWDERLARLLPGPIRIGEKGIEAYGKRYSSPGTLLLASFPHPVDRSRTITLLVGLSEEAFPEGIARRLLHYGWESHLLFDGGRLIDQGQLPPAVPFGERVPD